MRGLGDGGSAIRRAHERGEGGWGGDKDVSRSSQRQLAQPRCGRARDALLAFALFALFVLATIGTFGVAAAQATTYNTWTAQTPGVNVTYYGVGFADANNGWLVGGTVNVRHTTNGGATWSAQTLTPTTTQSLRSVSCGPLERSGRRRRRGRLSHDQWRRGLGLADFRRHRHIYGASFADANNGWFCTTGGGVRHTTNGGTTWTAQTTGVTRRSSASTSQRRQR